MIRSDSHFVIGHSHTLVEDYAANLAGFAALADGCSAVLDAAGNRIEAHTDIGARLLVRSAFHHQKATDDLFGSLLVHTADSYRRQLDMPIETLSATLLALRVDENAIVASMYGDGVIAGRRRDGRWDTHTVSFFRSPPEPGALGPTGPPRYPRYDLSEKDAESYAKLGCELYVRVDREWECRCPAEYPYRCRFFLCDYDLVVGMSDGAMSFTTKDAQESALETILPSLLDFRRMKGRFVLRQLTGVLKELARDGVVHQDDISMVALYDGEPEKPCPSTS